MVDRTRRELTEKDIQKIADTYHAWRGGDPLKIYADIPGFCKSSALDEIRKHDYVLTHGCYVGSEAAAEDTEPFSVKFPRLVAELEEQFKESDVLTQKIRENFKLLGVDHS